LRSLYSFPTRRSSDLRSLGVPPSPVRGNVEPYRSRNASRDQRHRSCASQLPPRRVESQRGLTSSAGSQTTPVGNPPQRLVPGSADRKSTRLNSSHQII